MAIVKEAHCASLPQIAQAHSHARSAARCDARLWSRAPADLYSAIDAVDGINCRSRDALGELHRFSEFSSLHLEAERPLQS